MLSRSERKILEPGTAQAQCAECNESFSNVELFDLHRRHPKGCSENFAQFCEIMDIYQEHGIWGTEEWHDKNEALKERLAAGKAAKRA